MCEESEVLEVPNWLAELEEKRQRRLKVKLGHEAGAGAPCLTCIDKCPGLDLHFWRKICKNCKCSKEDHDVHDDDIYGWAQFQLLGSKPNRIKKKIILPGKKDEVELDWTPKGHSETVDRFLKTLPAEFLPVKGSAAAQNRKQLLQKQIPIHDIDPSLCHELTDSEMQQMLNYIEHVKSNSVGVGQIVQFGLHRGNLHLIDRSNVEPVDLKQPERSKNLSKHMPDLTLNDRKELNAFFDTIPNPSNMTHYSENVNNSAEINRNLSEPQQIQHQKTLPKYDPKGLTSIQSEMRNPIGNIRDLAFSTYDQQNSNNLPQYNPERNRETLSQNLEPTQVGSGAIRDIIFNPNANINTSTSIQSNLPRYEQKISGSPNDERNSNNLHSYNPERDLSKPNAIPQYNPQNIGIYSENLNPDQINLGGIRDVIYDTNLPGIKNAVRPNNHPYEGGEQPRYEQTITGSPNDVRNSNNLPQYNPERDLSKPHAIPQYNPQNIDIYSENLNPDQINIGGIRDVVYDTNLPEIKNAVRTENHLYSGGEQPTIALQDHEKKCRKCSLPFGKDEFAILVDRSGCLYHSDCFRCAGCNQSLADMVYFFDKESGQVYCGRDYAKIRGIPRCKACDELIFLKEYCLAESCTFHVKHFCCFECDVPLAGRNYVMEGAQPVCLPCYEKNNAEVCAGCSNVIRPDEQGCNLNGVHFHATDECFACKMCKRPMMGAKLLLRNRKLYCSHPCFNNDQ